MGDYVMAAVMAAAPPLPRPGLRSPGARGLSALCPQRVRGGSHQPGGGRPSGGAPSPSSPTTLSTTSPTPSCWPGSSPPRSGRSWPTSGTLRSESLSTSSTGRVPPAASSLRLWRLGISKAVSVVGFLEPDLYERLRKGLESGRHFIILNY